MNIEELRTFLKAEESKAFSGWDFSYLEGRWENKELPWDYKDIVLKYLKPGARLLDMGTGGGEFLLTLGHPYNLTSVTESYPPNVDLCKETLAPLGIEVKQVFDDKELPFSPGGFDTVINRHESFDVHEVRRILKNGGYFITQQVGGQNNNDLSKQVIDKFSPLMPDFNMTNTTEELKKAGFEVLYANECYVPLRFFDLGAFVYFAKIIEWEFPGFSVDTHFNNLCGLQAELIQKGFIEGTEHRFLIVSRILNK
jgi:SAM-dependent methyltransferase